MLKSKNTLFAILLLWMAIGLSAAPITREQARQRAEAFLKATRGNKMLTPVNNKAKLSPRRLVKGKTTETELYYVFNRGEQEGYVIVSGDDQTRPVLGYTDEGEFDYAQLPDNMRYWLEGYEQELLYLSQHPETLTEKPRYAPTHEAIAPMVTTRWNQGAPYNDECPMYFSLGRSITGCVATAMAQVLYYQRAKSVSETQAAIPAYDTYTAHPTYGHLHVEGIPAGSPIDWDNMLDSYGSGATAKQKLAVAQLMHYCGVSVQMDYTNSSSGANSYRVADAFNNYFGYGTAARYVYKNNGYTDDTWDALLYKELAEGRPFYLSGQNSEAGHAFVCDGYDGNGCFHINWGWGGSSDGYFLLNRLNPSSQGLGGSSGGYSDYAEAVIGCEPENYSEKAMPIANTLVKNLCLEHFDANGDGVFTFGEAASVTDLGDAFRGQTNLTAFTELYSFTGLTDLPDDAFNGCTKLATIKLPKRLKSIGKRAFAGCRLLKSITLPDGLMSIGDSAFAGCRMLPNQTLPIGMERIENNTFEGCQAFTTIQLPHKITYVGRNAFKGCTKLNNVTLKSVAPQEIVLGEGVFEGIDLSEATLNILQGTHDYFASTDQWKDFGNIDEERNLAQGKYATLETNKKFYIYNVGTGRYLTKGEAWGTQAIVDETDEPMRFEFRHTASMPDGVYYLYSTDTEADKYVLFRTNNDNSVGKGVNACFVDGTLSANAYWKVELAEGKDNVYTLQIPSNQSGYTQGLYLGIQPDHASNASAPTFGAYSDVDYSLYKQNCHWMLIEYDEQVAATFQVARVLENLLTIGKSKRVSMDKELAVYNNLDSSIPDIEKAIRNMRRKLNFIIFADPTFQSVALRTYDTDNNGEISYTEATNIPSIDTEFSQNTDLVDASDLHYFTGLEYISGNAFKNCTKLQNVVLPDQLLNIYYRAFMGDSNLQSISIGSNVMSIGSDAFNGCRKLTEVRIAVHDPANISLGENVFLNVKTANATLYVPYGAKERYAQADVWKDFGNIQEMRTVAAPTYAEAETETDYYVYNLSQQRYINKGEAWGTQAVVNTKGFTYQLRRTNSMPDGVYYLYSATVGEGSGKNILFRTSGDSKVGEGVKTCFVDGNSVTANAYWKLKEVEGKPHVYTLQVPENDPEYVEGEYLGCDYNHTTKFAYGTYGLYWDISYSDNPKGCEWAFINIDEQERNAKFFQLTENLKELLAKADAKAIEATAEHAVYDNPESTEDDINGAIASLRRKLDYIDFADNRAKTLCVYNWDEDEDGEITHAEAAAITDIGQTFRNSSAMKSFEELRYFTSLTSLPAESFRGCSALSSLYLPAGVTSIGERAFTNCSVLKYLAVLSEAGIVEASTAALPSKLTVFVPQALTEAYAADDAWKRSTIKEYTGVPTVTAQPAARLYGRSNPTFNFEVSGAPINGLPELTCDAVATTPVGEYEIVASAGTITSPALVTQNSVFTINRSPLTLTAKSYTRNWREENPDFDFSHSSLRNKEKIDSVLIVRPTLECDATFDSPAGKYEIRISGAETQNYEITYVNGWLTIEETDGIEALTTDRQSAPVYDLSGRPTLRPKRGVYIQNGKKVVR